MTYSHTLFSPGPFRWLAACCLLAFCLPGGPAGQNRSAFRGTLAPRLYMNELLLTAFPGIQTADSLPAMRHGVLASPADSLFRSSVSQQEPQATFMYAHVSWDDLPYAVPSKIQVTHVGDPEKSPYYILLVPVHDSVFGANRYLNLIVQIEQGRILRTLVADFPVQDDAEINMKAFLTREALSSYFPADRADDILARMKQASLLERTGAVAPPGIEFYRSDLRQPKVRERYTQMLGLEAADLSKIQSALNEEAVSYTDLDYFTRPPRLTTQDLARILNRGQAQDWEPLLTALTAEGLIDTEGALFPQVAMDFFAFQASAQATRIAQQYHLSPGDTKSLWFDIQSQVITADVTRKMVQAIRRLETTLNTSGVDLTRQSQLPIRLTNVLKPAVETAARPRFEALYADHPVIGYIFGSIGWLEQAIRAEDPHAVAQLSLDNRNYLSVRFMDPHRRILTGGMMMPGLRAIYTGQSGPCDSYTSIEFLAHEGFHALWELIETVPSQTGRRRAIVEELLPYLKTAHPGMYRTLIDAGYGDALAGTDLDLRLSDEVCAYLLETLATGLCGDPRLEPRTAVPYSPAFKALLEQDVDPALMARMQAETHNFLYSDIAMFVRFGFLPASMHPATLGLPVAGRVDLESYRRALLQSGALPKDYARQSLLATPVPLLVSLARQNVPDAVEEILLRDWTARSTGVNTLATIGALIHQWNRDDAKIRAAILARLTRANEAGSSVALRGESARYLLKGDAGLREALLRQYAIMLAQIDAGLENPENMQTTLIAMQCAAELHLALDLPSGTLADLFAKWALAMAPEAAGWNDLAGETFHRPVETPGDLLACLLAGSATAEAAAAARQAGILGQWESHTLAQAA